MPSEFDVSTLIFLIKLARHAARVGNNTQNCIINHHFIKKKKYISKMNCCFEHTLALL